MNHVNNYAASLSSADMEDIRNVTDFTIRQKAPIRWLFPEEIYFLLTVLQVQDMWKDVGRNIVMLSTDSPRYPKNGELYMYDKRFTVGFRDDGVAWMKKKGAKSKLQETYQSIKIEGVEIISGVYSRAEENQNFSRRIYRIIEDSDKFVLIHYRDSEKRESAPTGRQDQHPHLIFLLQRIRMEFNNLSISQLTKNSGGGDDVFPSSHHLGAMVEGIREANGSCYNGSSNEVLPKSHAPQSVVNDYLRTVFSMPTHQSQFVNCNASFNQAVHTTASLHSYSRSYNPSHQTDTTLIPHLDAVYYNEPHFPMQSYPEPDINPSDLEFLLDMQLESESSHPMKANPFLAITDFSPSTCSDQGGTKILVCLDPKSDLSKVVAPGKSFFINFGVAAKTVAEVLTSTVLRCMSPPVKVGSYQLWISDSDEKILSMKSSDYMDITPSMTLPTIEYSNYGRQKANNYDRTSKELVESDCGSSADLSNSSKSKSSGVKHARSGKSSSLQLACAPYSSSLSERENKIRIVEKLGYMRSSLMGTRSASSFRGPNSPAAQDMVVSDDEEGGFVNSFMVISSTDAAKKGSLESTSGGLGPMHVMNDGETSPLQSKTAVSFNAEDGNEWLDENQLSHLSIEELEKEMDKNITAVVKQMVQLASLDDDLKTEIDSLDSNGFSLLHYCCLYNLTSLIPVLLARGATVDKKSSNGSTPLHLSASAGNLAVCELLIESGASLLQKDGAGFLAKDVAHMSAQQQISRYLQAVEDRLNVSDFGSRLCSTTNVSNKFTPSKESAAMASSPLHEQPQSNPVQYCDVRLSLPSDTAAIAMQLADSGGEAREAALSNKLLQQAFASLSLTDKCALSLTLSQQHNSSTNLLQSSPLHNSRSPVESSPSTSGKQRSIDFILGESVHRDAQSSQRLFQHSENSSCVSSSAPDDSDIEMDLDVNLGVGVDFDMQSVLSEVDKESLGAAMKMMGNSDLQQIEEEVRKIQNNVRGWLLRKNYINLREAAKVLQMAWREKKKAGSSTIVRLTSPPPFSSFKAARGSSFEEDGSRIRKDSLASSVDTFSKSTTADAKELNDLESVALARLQARTRGMLARKSFSSIRKQTMASLVIQKSLIKWWQNKGDNSCEKA